MLELLINIISFVNTTEQGPVERLLIPDMALTAAEYFAVDKMKSLGFAYRHESLC